jgi:hypothetical protein
MISHDIRLYLGRLAGIHPCGSNFQRNAGFVPCRDRLWTGRSLGVVSGSYATTVAAGGVSLISAGPA